MNLYKNNKLDKKCIKQEQKVQTPKVFRISICAKNPIDNFILTISKLEADKN